MMSETTLRMFRDDGTLVGLADILDDIDGGRLVWRLRSLWATGRPGGDLDVLELEERVRQSESGLELRWPELVALANRLDQVIDAELEAYDPAGDAVRVVLRIEARDSTDWVIWTAGSDG